MTHETTHRLRAATAALLLLLGAAPALAQDTLQLTSAVFQEVEVRGADGKPQKKTIPAAKVTPGAEVIYVITYRNAGTRAAEQVVIRNPLPKELEYAGGPSTRRGARLEVSVDGGAQYGALPTLRVRDADGKARPARPADVTHLRWTLARAIAPGEEGSVSYRATLK